MSRRSLAIAGLLSCATFVVPALATSRAVIAAAPIAIRTDGIDLTSTAAASVTKRVAEHAVRQLARYRIFLPPRVVRSASTETDPLRIELFGTLADYRAAVAKRGLRVENPACYIPASHLILLGFDGAKFDDVLHAADERARKIDAVQREASRRFANSQKEQEQRFRSENVSAQRRHDLLQRQKGDFQRSKAAADRQRKEAQEKNEKLLDEATARLLALAAHELFHAYVEAEVYPRGQGGLPPWLDEGLAQLVENGSWRNDALIVNTRSPELVKQLRDEMIGGPLNGAAPSVASILAQEGKHYLVGGAQDSGEVGRRYVFAWALVQLLAETNRLTPREALDRYAEDRDAEPTARFMRLTKKTPAEFEAEWCAYLAQVTR